VDFYDSAKLKVGAPLSRKAGYRITGSVPGFSVKHQITTETTGLKEGYYSTI
jgi:hypothetical protein